MSPLEVLNVLLVENILCNMWKSLHDDPITAKLLKQIYGGTRPDISYPKVKSPLLSIFVRVKGGVSDPNSRSYISTRTTVFVTPWRCYFR